MAVQIPSEDFRKEIGTIQVPQNPALISDSLAAPTKGSKANVSRRAVSFTDKDPKRLITGEVLVANHVIQPPLVDGLKTVGNIAKSLVDGIFNFQQTNYRSWFGLRPQLIIRSSTEFVEIGGTQIDDSALAMGYKRLASRAANRVYHYCEAVKLLVCAMYNMASIARFEGDTFMKNFASDLRSSRLNTMLANAAKYPVPKGIYDQIKSSCIFLAGVTADGVPVISIPMIDVSIFGNRAVQCSTPSNFQSLSGRHRRNVPSAVSSGKAAFLDSNDQIGSLNAESEADAFSDLMQNIEATIYHFAGSGKRLNGATLTGGERLEAQKHYYDFRGPNMLNTTTINVSSDGNFNAMAKLNGHGPVLLSERVNDYNLNYEFTRLVMNQAFEIMRYLDENFSDFAVIGNDWYDLVTRDLGLCEKSGIRISQMISDARGMKYGDINEYLDAVKLKRDSAISSHSVVKYMPIVGVPTYEDRTGGVGEFLQDSMFIKNNFERFDFSLENPNYTLRNAKRVPRFNPTLFFIKEGTDHEVYAANTGPNFIPSTIRSVQTETSLDTKIDHALLVNGQRALFDYTRVVQNDPSISRMRFNGITPDTAKEIVDKDNAVTVYYEDKTQLFIDSLCAVDPTDMYATGFSILFFHKGMFPSFVVRELMDVGCFISRDEQYKVPTRGIANDADQLGSGLFPLSPSVAADSYTADDGAKAATQVTPEFVQDKGVVSGYVGAGILQICEEIAMLSPTGTFAYCDTVDSDAKADFYKSAIGKNSRGFTDILSTGDNEAGGIPSFKMAMCPLSTTKNENPPAKLLKNSNMNVLDLLAGSAGGSTDSHVIYKFAASECGRIRFNVDASPLSGFRSTTKGMLPDSMTRETAEVKPILGQLHNGADYTSEDDNSIDPVVDCLMEGELQAISQTSLLLDRVVTANPVVDNQSLMYSDYPFVAYQGEHYLPVDNFILKLNADTEVTAVGTKDEEYMLDVIGSPIKSNYIAPAVGKYQFSENNYVAEVYIKTKERDYGQRMPAGSTRDSQLKTVGFKADRTSGDSKPKDKSTTKKRNKRKGRVKVKGAGNPNERDPNENHMIKEMKETLGPSTEITDNMRDSLKGDAERGKKSYGPSDVS